MDSVTRAGVPNQNLVMHKAGDRKFFGDGDWTRNRAPHDLIRLSRESMRRGGGIECVLAKSSILHRTGDRSELINFNNEN